MAKRENTLPSHMRKLVDTAEVKFRIPAGLYRSLSNAKKMCREKNIEFDLDGALAKTVERAVRQTEKYFDSLSYDAPHDTQEKASSDDSEPLSATN
ncbi:hypothetical protein [Thiolapillus sp.]|uniref:hypothetical protein n=1 Tax=Thiolapillus sp. TaxID=2017437 RepID=UPI003AF6CEE4